MNGFGERLWTLAAMVLLTLGLYLGVATSIHSLNVDNERRARANSCVLALDGTHGPRNPAAVKACWTREGLEPPALDPSAGP